MEANNQHFVEEYVQDFFLDHLEDVTVKSEDTHHLVEMENWMQQEDSSSTTCWRVQQGLMAMTLSNDSFNPYQPPGVLDEMRWVPQSTRFMPQPLDLRPLTSDEPDWHSREDIPSEVIPEPNKKSLPSEKIDDKVLTSLPVKDLNKKLHGYQQDEVNKLKHRRRMLKNRIYAQVCRRRRDAKVKELEKKNQSLLDELRRGKNELAWYEQECLRLRLLLEKGKPEGQNTCEFYL